MIDRTISVLKDLADALTKDETEKRAVLPFLHELQESVQGTVQETVETVQEKVEMVQEAVQKAVGGERIAMPFLHNMTPDIISEWNLQDFNPANPNDKPNMNIAVMALILATNIESTVGKYPWSLVEYSLDRLGFTKIVHH